MRWRGREERLELTCGEGEFRIERLVDVNPGPEEALPEKVSTFEGGRTDPNKNAVLALFLSFLPGAGYMYLGLMNKGLQTMVIFFGTIFVAGMTQKMGSGLETSFFNQSLLKYLTNLCVMNFYLLSYFIPV